MAPQDPAAGWPARAAAGPEGGPGAPGGAGSWPVGRGAATNPPNRFVPLHVDGTDRDDDPDALPPGGAEGGARPRTQFLRDASRSILSFNDSPDLGFAVSVNPYRGCEHGCAYCYARPYHEYLGFSAGLDFETRILVKEDAPELLREALLAPRWTPQPIAMSGVTDCYQPVERRLGITRRCLEVLAEFRNPVAIVTKNALVTRDLDVLRRLAEHDAAVVWVSVTTLDRDLQRRLEPRTSPPAMRLEAVAALRAAGIPAGVLMAPVLPALTDHEIPAVVEAAARVGAVGVGYTLLRLPHGVRDVFTSWLERFEPGRREKVLSRIRSLRKGRLNDPRYGHRMRGEGPFAEQVASLFAVSRRRHGVPDGRPALSTAAFRRPERGQLTLFAT